MAGAGPEPGAGAGAGGGSQGTLLERAHSSGGSGGHHSQCWPSLAALQDTETAAGSAQSASALVAVVVGVAVLLLLLWLAVPLLFLPLVQAGGLLLSPPPGPLYHDAGPGYPGSPGKGPAGAGTPGHGQPSVGRTVPLCWMDQ